MFIVAELKSTIKINAVDINKNLAELCKIELNKKLANKVLHNVGLCIQFREVVSLGDSAILPNDGSVYTSLKFRHIVFRPEIGSLINGKIKSCNEHGIYITVGFFDDIFIPKDELQHPSRYNEIEHAWIWEYPVEDGSKHDLFMDVGETIKLRVIGEEFVESEPLGPPGVLNCKEQDPEAVTTKINARPLNGNNNNNQNPTKVIGKKYKIPPYKIIGAINEPGLGLDSWWTNEEEELNG